MTIRYKQQGRQKRVLHPDGNFNKGMRFTEGFLDAGNTKALLNYRIMDSGAYIMPRNGIGEYARKVRTFGIEGEVTETKYAAPHVGFYGVYRDPFDEDRHGFIMVSFGVPTSPKYKYYKTDPDANYFSQTIGGGVGYITLMDNEGEDHIVNVNGFSPEVQCFYYKNEPKPVFAVHDSTLYFHHSGVLSQLKIAWNAGAGQYVATVLPIVGKEVTISESTSIGFNMFDDDPYYFDNTGSTLDTHSVKGVLPYSPLDNTKIRLSANPGEPIKFVAFYTFYPGKSYRCRWEVAEYGTTDYKILADYGPNTTVVNGQEAAITLVPEYNKFILRMTMCPYVGSVLDETLAKVGIYPVYELSISEVKDLGYSTNFNLNTATGMFTHGGMLGLFGVERAENAIFLSDGYDPTYFPFPHNSFTFPDKVIHVESFAGAIFIFTERKLYVVEGTYVPEMYGPYVLLDNVDFTQDDMRTVIPVKTGLFFRMNGMFHMLVPNSYTGKVADMRLINISNPVNDILFNFTNYIRILSDRLYKFKVSWSVRTTIENYDFLNYVDSGRVRNIFRFVIMEDNIRYQLDLIMVYDTDNGLWYTESASFPYPGIISSGTALYSAYVKRGATTVDLYLQRLTYSNRSCEDTYNTMFYGVAENDKATSVRESELALFPIDGADTVVEVVDGDTVDLAGLGRVRLLYVNTPESFGVAEPFGLEAKMYLTELLPPGTTVFYEFDAYGDRVDAYDRALVWLRIGDANGEIVQVLIARQGYVKSYYDFGATKYINNVETAVAYAKGLEAGLYKYVQPEGPYYIRTVQSTNLLGNFQLLDSGNRNHTVYLEKKYKEIQFMISNDSPAVLEFYAEFYADSVLRNEAREYVIEQMLDPESDDYGTIYVTEKETPNLLAGNETQFSSWQLDLSMFPDVEVVKVILRVNGIGHYPRFIFVSRNQMAYKLLGFAWAYRPMNAR